MATNFEDADVPGGVTTGGETVTGGGSTTRKTVFDSTGYPSGLVTTTTPGVSNFTPAGTNNNNTNTNNIASPPVVNTNPATTFSSNQSQGELSTVTVTATQDDSSNNKPQSSESQGTLQEVVVTPAPEIPPKAAPGARPHNPLSMFSSYTYHITLYMITPQSYNKFVEQGNKGITPEDMFIVAESGGSNVNGKNMRLFDLDFYIDDFSFQTYLSTNSNKGASVDSLSFSWKIYEPFGFRFMSALKDAAYRVVNKSNLPGHDGAKHHLQQLYMIGIKFYGYDADGNLVTDDTSNQLRPNSPTYSVSKGTSTYAEFADNGVFARYFPINITELQFRLDGKATVYNFKAINVSVNTGNGSKNNQIKTSQALTGKTVEELLSTGENSLEKLLNKIQEDLLKKGDIGIKNVFQIKFKNGETSKIKNSIIAAGKASDRNKSAMSGSANVTDSSKANDKTSQSAKPDNNTRTFEIPAGTSITQAIERVIAQSSYITDALTAKGNEDMTNWSEEAKAIDRTRLEWFVITPICKMLGFDKKIKDYAYEITYLINEYKIPRVRSVYVSEPAPYYGAHKIYEYWFTGKNSEVLSYEQKYNGLFHLSALENPEPGKDYQNSGGLPVSVKPGSKQNADDSGLFDKAGQIIASVRTSLYSPGEQAMATIQIMGDPDFICTTVGMNYGVYDEYYGPDKSVDPHAGQVFVQIVFNEGIDYSHEDGLMDIETNIKLYEYPKYLKGTKGIIYSASDVVSTFSKGRFTQELHLVMYSPPPDPPEGKSESARETDSLASRYPAPTKGFTPDDAAKSSEPKTQPASQIGGSSSYTGDLNSTNSSMLGAITGGRVKVANETNLSSTNVQNVVQGPNDDSPGVTVSTNVKPEGRPFVMYGVRG
jgi:hypothetical protein